MPVRKTERRLPFYFTADDLGQSISASDGRFHLISFNPDPVAEGRLQQYAVFVTDDGLAGQVDHFEWQLQNGDTTETQTTDVGYLRYQPGQQGALSVEATLKDSGDQLLGSLKLDQGVVPLNPELEALYSQTDDAAPLAGQPETSRELINDLRAYIDDLAPREADPDSALNKLLFSIAYAEVIQNPVQQRAPILEEIAQSLHADDSSELLNRASEGLGVCQIRPYVLAMYFSASASGSDTLIEKVPFPEEEESRVEIENSLLAALEGLDEDALIDLFNLLRFPKLNLKMALHMIAELKEEYYSGEALPEIMTDKDKIINLLDQFKQGPFQSS